mmetsp:Transcript_7280/g.5275  ORF Transcript_7280/g.5275 Transcript_7280/m.5275 type:complete len:92 (-) Transcript_7280:220-495(-)
MVEEKYPTVPSNLNTNISSGKANCLFCGFLKSRHNLWWEDDQFYLFMDNNPKADYHYLMIPKQHIPDSGEIKLPADIEMVQNMNKKANELL